MSEDNTTQTPTHRTNMVPASIIVAGGLIAAAIILSSNNAAVGNGQAAVGVGGEFGNGLSASAENIASIGKDEHIFGNRNAPVAIVEFSDFECPFCSRHHPTLKQIVADFGDEVRWVYRHFPLTSIHSEALGAAIASECIAELGGNDAFWDFTDRIFANQRSMNSALYAQIAADVGIDAKTFTSCLESEKMLEAVITDGEDATLSGGTGTPYTVVINKAGETFPFSGALPYENVRTVIEQALGNS
jgi:protein-disulfide isomerase